MYGVMSSRKGKEKCVQLLFHPCDHVEAVAHGVEGQYVGQGLKQALFSPSSMSLTQTSSRLWYRLRLSVTWHLTV